MPVESIEAAREWLRQRNEEIGKGGKAPNSLNEARMRKVLLECRILEMRVEAIENVEEAPLSLIQDFVRDFCEQAKWRMHFRAQSLVTELAGLNEVEAYEVLREVFADEFFHSVCHGMKDQTSPLALVCRSAIKEHLLCAGRNTPAAINRGIADAVAIARQAKEQAESGMVDEVLALTGKALALVGGKIEEE